MTSKPPAQVNGEDANKFRLDRKKIYFLALFIVIGVPVCWFGWIFSYAFSAGPIAETTVTPPQQSTEQTSASSDAKGKYVTIPPNSGLYRIRRILAQRGVIFNDRRFIHTARLFDLTNKLKAGDYFFTFGQTPYQILRDLEAGKVVQLQVTIPEGNTMYQIADLFAAQEIVDRDAFLSLIKDPDYIKSLGLEIDSLEGYLFPDTYRLSSGQRAEFVIQLMVDRMLGVLEELGVDEKENNPAYVKKTFNRHEVLTLASIVEKETAQGDERPLIARVFHNRLMRGMRLQTDPTVIYGIKDFDGNLRRKDLETLTPYNTYMIRGLPPGPIGNPGREAIHAVLHPAEESYLYFVSKNDGTHYFSKSLIEHNKAVMKYQKSRKYRRRNKSQNNKKE